MSDITVTTQGGESIDITVQSSTSVEVTSPASSSVSVTEKGPKGDTGATGPAGAVGPAGPGFSSGGTENQFIQKNSATDYDTKWSAYTLPATDGDDGQVLTTNGAATVTFAYPKTIAEDVKNVSGGPLLKGTPVHVTGSVGNLAEVIAADAATNYPAHFVLNEDLDDEEEGLGIAIGFINNVNVPDASIYTEGQTVYLGESGGWTTTKPTGANAIQNLGIIIKVNTSSNKISGIIMGAGRANDVPNIATGNIWAGNADGVATATDTAYIDIANSRVGIGTVTPSSTLHVVGADSLNASYSVKVSNSSASNVFSLENNGDFSLGVAGAKVARDNGANVVKVSAGNAQVIVGTEDVKLAANYTGKILFQNSYTNNAVFTNDGKFGIGTTSPTEKLTVSGNISVSGDVYSDGSIHADEIKGRTYPTYNILSLEDDNLPNQNGVSLSSVGSMAFHLDVNNNSANDSFDWKADAPTSGSATSLMRLTDEGNLGIGTTSPSAKLDVVGFANIKDGSNNVMISSANTAMTGASNTTVGYQAGRSNTSGGSNSFVGLNAGYSNTIGDSNSFVGRNAGYSNTSGGSNSFVGYQAGNNNDTGSSNTSVGYAASYSNTTGFSNTAVGRSALYNSTGSLNVAIGREAAYGGVGASFSNTTAVGNQSLYSLTTGTDNTAVGYQAGLSNTNGSLNAFLGRNAGRSNTNGSENAFVGVSAGYSNTTGNNNSILGRSAGFNNTTGSGNIFIGYKAGYNETGSNKLYIANTDTSTPLIYGEFDNDILNVNGKLKPNSITVDDEGLSAAGDYGAGAEIWYQGTSTPLAGSCYYLDSTGGWTAARANAAGTATGMLAVSAGTDSDVDGMVLRGFVQIGHTLTGSVGDAVYVDTTTAGRFTTTKPTGTGNFVRRVGYLAKGTNVIYFNPSPEWEAL